MSTNVQAMTIAMFGAAAGGYTAELEASVEASGVAAVANSIMSLQQPLLGLDLSDNAVWTDFVLGNLGINDTNAAYGEASAYFAARFAAGASRGDIVAEAVAYLLGTPSAEFAAIAEAFVALVAEAVEWSAGDGAEVIAFAELRDADGIIGNPATGSVFNLTAALATLAAANDALDAAEAAAADVAQANFAALGYADPDANDDGTISAAEQTAWDAAWADSATDLADAEGDVVAAELALANARAGTIGNVFASASLSATYEGQVASDARITAAVAAAQAIVDADADDAIADAQADIDASQAAIDADVTANGTNLALLTDLREALIAEIDANGDSDYVALGATLAEILVSIDVALAVEDDPETDADEAADALVAVIADIAAAGPANTGVTAIDDAGDLIDARFLLNDALATDEAAYDAVPAIADLAAAELLASTREGLVTDLSDAEAVLEAVSAAADAYDAAFEAQAEAEAAVEADYDLAVIGIDNAGAGSDLFVYDGENGGTIANFGDAGQDLIYFGTGYTLVTLAEDETVADIVGDQNALEIFVVDNGTAAPTLYVETNAFDGNAANNGDVVAISLTGVTVGLDVSLTSSGYLSVA